MGKRDSEVRLAATRLLLGLIAKPRGVPLVELAPDADAAVRAMLVAGYDVDAIATAVGLPPHIIAAASISLTA